jgi:hypothetical protein
LGVRGRRRRHRECGSHHLDPGRHDIKLRRNHDDGCGHHDDAWQRDDLDDSAGAIEATPHGVGQSEDDDDDHDATGDDNDDDAARHHHYDHTPGDNHDNDSSDHDDIDIDIDDHDDDDALSAAPHLLTSGRAGDC